MVGALERDKDNGVRGIFVTYTLDPIKKKVMMKEINSHFKNQLQGQHEAGLLVVFFVRGGAYVWYIGF